ncbi:hypothetical protein [Halorientalis sp.]|uniref:hypothetical protein n=1 Tax=Halorientalis sp. TaxID=1931229 RepID=UPI0026107CC9|nr:hypothetical protein [Halorientalis sp.]
MNRPNLRGRVPETIAARLPGGESDGAGNVAGNSSDDGVADEADGSGSRRWTTLLALSGLGLAALGVGLRYALDGRSDSETDAATETGTDVTDETLEASADTGDGNENTDDDGPPRIAPAVGMVALVGIRLFVERVRKQYADATNGAAG